MALLLPGTVSRCAASHAVSQEGFDACLEVTGEHVLQMLAAPFVRHWVGQTRRGTVVVSAGVAANVEWNQRIHEAA